MLIYETRFFFKKSYDHRFSTVLPFYTRRKVVCEKLHPDHMKLERQELLQRRFVFFDIFEKARYCPSKFLEVLIADHMFVQILP